MHTWCGRRRRLRGHAGALTDRPTLRAHAYSLLRTILTSAVNDELVGANPARIAGAGRTKRAHTIRPASVAELAELTAAMPERLALMVTLASWCALRFGELIELRRGDVDLSTEVVRIRRGAIRTAAGTVVTTPRVTPACATSTFRRTSSRSLSNI